MVKLGLLKEEERTDLVALTPAYIARLTEYYEVEVETGAGIGVGFADDDYVKVGASIAVDRIDLIRKSDVIVSFNSRSNFKFDSKLKSVVGFYDVLKNYAAIAPFTNQNVDLYSIDLISSTAIVNPSCDLKSVNEKWVNDDITFDSEVLSEIFAAYLLHLAKKGDNPCVDIIKDTQVLSKGQIVHQRVIEEVNKL